MLITETKNKEYFVNIYNENLEKINNYSSELIKYERNKAIQDFQNIGFPDKKNEKYKYTNIESAFNSSLKCLFTPVSANINLDEIFRCDVPELDTNIFITVNGWFHDKELIKISEKGFIIGSLSEASKKYPELFEKYYNKFVDKESDAITSLNTAFAQDGIFIYVPEGVVIEKPIQIINLVVSDEELLINQKNLVIIENSSEAKIIVCDHSLTPHKFLYNTVTEVFAGQYSRVDYYKVQNSHNHSTQISSTFICQKDNSNVLSDIITLHGGLIRNNINVLLDGKGCENFVGGLYLVDKFQHVDNYVSIDHAKPNCMSRQVFRGVLDDNATGAFNGKILVRKDSQHTNAYQTNNNILLTNDAKINTKPQLEIYADDVKCSHGATVGQLDENALFYLRARGIEIKEAKLLLMYAFAHEIIKQIRVEPLKDRINELVEKRLRGELSRCNCCSINCGK